MAPDGFLAFAIAPVAVCPGDKRCLGLVLSDFVNKLLGYRYLIVPPVINCAFFAEKFMEGLQEAAGRIFGFCV